MPASERILTAADVTGMWLPQEPQVSPDGRLVAFAAQAASKPKGQKRPRAAVWVAPSDGSRPAVRWTQAAANERLPRWSPDGHCLAFLSDRGKEGEDQVYVFPVAGGEARPLTDCKGGVTTFAWSPDGKRIAFTAADEALAAERERREQSGEDVSVWGEQSAMLRLRVCDLDGGSVKTLSPADRHVTDFAWSPSAQELAAALAVRPDLNAPAEAGEDVVVLPAAGGAVRLVCHVPFDAGGLLWSQDGGTILFDAWEALSIPSSRALFAVEASGGSPRCVTRGMHGCVLRAQRPPASRAVLVTVAEGLGTGVYALDPESGTRTRTRMDLPVTPHPGTFGVDATGSVMALVAGSGGRTPDVWAGSSGSGFRQVSRCNPQLEAIGWAEQEPFEWTAPDGLRLDGLVLRPTEHAESTPGIVLPHGGPYARWFSGFNLSGSNWAQWLALDGYAVFMPNPRGGMGHGHDFAATVAGEVGMADWLDVASGTDAFVEARLADPNRLGIGGWSQGGFMTNWAVSGGIRDGAATRAWDDAYATWRPGSVDRFRAGVAGAGPTDWGSMTTESDMPAFEAMLGGSRLGDGVGPHRHAVVSPISYSARVRTPLLFLHGRDDERVPVGQATGFFRELRSRRVPVELAIYPREPHGVQEQAHQADILDRVRRWYGRWLKA